MDRTVDETFYLMFTTRIFATGVPGTLAGTPVVSAYEDGSTTQITAGITLGVDHDSVTGLNLLTIVATTGNGFEAGKDYNLVITTGTVSGVSVVGVVVGKFSLGLSAAYTHVATQLVDEVWDEVLTGATHNVAASSGRRLRGLSAVPFLEGTVVDASATTTVIETSLTGYGDNFFIDVLFMVELSTDDWQARTVTSYSSSTGEFTLEEALISAPANGVNIALQVTHIHPINQIRDSILSDSTPFDGADIVAILAMLDDARAEPGQGAPPVNPDMATKIDYIYKFLRNRTTVTATEIKIYDDAGTTVDHKATHSDDTTTYTRGEIGTGP